MKKLKGISKMSLAFTLALLMLLTPTTALAHAFDDDQTIIVVYTAEEAIIAITENAGSQIIVELAPSVDVEELMSLLDDMYAGRALGTLTVFVASLFVGWIIDSVIIAATGQSAAQWGAAALSAFRNGIRGNWTFRPIPGCGCKGCWNN